MSENIKLVVPSGKTFIEVAAQKLFKEMINNYSTSATCTVECSDGTEIDITIDIHLK